MDIAPNYKGGHMLKIGLWLGTPPVIAFLSSPLSMRLENTLTVLALAVIALLVGIGPRFIDR